MTAAELTALKTEIDDDPKGLGYSGQTDQWITDKLNEAGASAETVNRGLIDTSEIMECFVAAELNALTPDERNTIKLYCNRDQLDMGNANIQSVFTSILDGTTTLANLLASATRDATRGEILFPDTVLTIVNVHLARRL